MASITLSRAGFVAFGLTVPGIVASYTPKTFYAADAIATPVNTPCIISGLELDEEPGAFSTIAFQGGGSSVHVGMMQFILFKPVMENVEFVDLEPDMVAFLDTYLATLKNNPLMTINGEPSTHFPFKEVKKAFAPKAWGRSEYHTIFLKYIVGLNI